MEFRQIRYALTVAKERSFTRAAARLNVSQSAISEQVKQLEGRIGFLLFRRTGRGVEVTEPGRSYLAEAQRVASDLISLDDVARRLKGRDQETLTLGVGSGMASLIAPALLQVRGHGLRRLRLDIRTAPTRVAFGELFEERLDAAFAVDADPERIPAGLKCERLGGIEMVLAVPPEHRLAGLDAPVDVARVFDEPLIMSELGVGYGQIVSELFESLGLRPNLLSIVDNIETQLAVVRARAGVAFVPPSAAALDVRYGTIAVVRTQPAARFELALFRRKQLLSHRKEAELGRIAALVGERVAVSAF